MKLVDFLYRMKDEDFYQNNKDIKLEDVLDELIVVGEAVQKYITEYGLDEVEDFEEVYFQTDDMMVEASNELFPYIMQLMLQEIK